MIKVIQKFKSDIVFYLTAQAIVSNSYNNPKLTFETNVLWTLNLLTALNKLEKQTSLWKFYFYSKCIRIYSLLWETKSNQSKKN